MVARRPTLVSPHETDVYRLLHEFEQRVADGEPLSFATFRALWRDMHFSHIFEVRSPSSGFNTKSDAVLAFSVDLLCICRAISAALVLDHRRQLLGVAALAHN